MDTIEEINKRLEHLNRNDLAYILNQLLYRDNRIAQAEHDLPYIMAEFASDVRDGKRWDTTRDANAFLVAYREKVQAQLDALIKREAERQEVFDAEYPAKAAGRG